MGEDNPTTDMYNIMSEAVQETYNKVTEIEKKLLKTTTIPDHVITDRFNILETRVK